MNKLRPVCVGFLRHAAIRRVLSQTTRQFSTNQEQEQEPHVDKKLFTPGPISTSRSVKEAMLVDLGSRDLEFLDVLQFVKEKLLAVAGVTNDTHALIIMQGSGTFGVESVIQCTGSSSPSAHYLVLENGAYGTRMSNMCSRLGIRHHKLAFDEDKSISLSRLEDFLKTNKHKFTHVAVVHSETTSGVLNRIDLIGPLIKKYLKNSSLIVDAVSSFGALPVDLHSDYIDFLVSCPNKCIESVPGFAFIICPHKNMGKLKKPNSLCLDLSEQHTYASRNSNQFRFTPPVHSLLACKQALIELDLEGGPAKRLERYTLNHEIVRKGLMQLGLRELVENEHEQSKILNSFLYPSVSTSATSKKKFPFEEFYQRLSQKRMIIYPGKVSKAPCFRVGNIGHLFSNDMFELVKCIQDVLVDMKFKLPLKSNF